MINVPCSAASACPVHTIVSGDTFLGIADAYSTTSEELQKLNEGVEPTALTIGQVRQVPACSDSMG